MLARWSSCPACGLLTLRRLNPEQPRTLSSLGKAWLSQVPAFTSFAPRGKTWMAGTKPGHDGVESSVLNEIAERLDETREYVPRVDASVN